ncbi:MAG: hypothetical protein EOP35_04955, partial [Rubrivivax sp.]
ATGVQIRDNTITGYPAAMQIVGGSSASGRIAGNTFITSGNGTGLDLEATFNGLIENNRIQGGALGINYVAANQLAGNTVSGATVGLQSNVVGTGAIGWVGASVDRPNTFEGNGTGVQLLAGAQMQVQVVRGNTVGVKGTGQLGGETLDHANLIEANVTGVNAFNGTIQFNRFSGNQTAINAASEQRILHNLFYRNTLVGIEINGKADVRVFNNTFYAVTGDNLRSEGGSTEVEVQNNLMWAMSGYDLYVANDSRYGFYSDYNNLFASGTGKVGFWTKDFADILDWQADIAKFDLHSVGATVVNPTWARPEFVSILGDDFRLREPVAGQRFSSPGIDAGNVLVDNGRNPAEQNLIANAGFENGLNGWEVNAGSQAFATPNGAAPLAYEGSNFFFAGGVAGGFARQTFTLAQLGLTVAQADGQDFELLFGGRIRMGVESPVDSGEVQLIFRNAANDVLATAVAKASGTTNRWELVGQRADVPFGTRSVEFVYKTNRIAGGNADGYFDQAFLYKVSESQASDLGAYGHASTDVPVTGSPRINLRSPDLYLDWEKFKPLNITWETFGNADDSPVRIDVYQDTADGPKWVANVVSATPDSGQFTWIPGNSGIDFNTHGLRIQVSLVTNAAVLDRSQETFTVPEDGLTYWVNDGSTAGDEYATAAGDNRNTGKSAGAPKPNVTNLFRSYDLQAGATLYVDTGNYALLESLTLSGTATRGFGIDEGFRLTGPTLAGHLASLFPIVPNERTWALLDLSDTDFVTISNLQLRDANRGILLTGGADAVELNRIEAFGHVNEGIYASQLNAGLQTWTGLNVHDNGQTGLVVSGTLGGIDQLTASRNRGNGGLYADGSLGFLINSTLTDNIGQGAYLYYPAAVRVQGNLFQGNSGSGLNYNVGGSSQALVGGAIGSGLGNRFLNNANGGAIISGNALVWGNVASGNMGNGNYGIGMSGGEARQNVVYGNANGLYMYSGLVTDNRIYSNDPGTAGSYGVGLWLSTATATGNTVYSNRVGVYTQGNSVLRSNLVYANTAAGVQLNGSSPQFIGNTVYQTTGDAVQLYGSAASAKFIDNILWAGTGGVALNIDANSQNGFTSNFNIFQGAVGIWQGTQRSSLTAWRQANFQDLDGQATDPLFVDIDGADGKLGYFSAASDGRDDDFHLQSTYGSFHGASLAPVLGAGGLPTLLTGTLTNDTANSPGIDRGALDQPFDQEPAPRGGYANIGSDGNTKFASLSPAVYVRVMTPNGGETVAEGETFTVRWRSDGFTGNVNLDISRDGSNWLSVSANEANDGVFDWTPGSGQFPGGDYVLRVSSASQPAVKDTSDATFNLASTVSIFYVNDGALGGDEYATAIGNDANDGRSASKPKASLQALLNAYDFKPGDLILIDTGVYNSSTNLLVDAQDSGVVIRGAVNHASILNRGNTNNGQYAFVLGTGTTDVTLDRVTLTGGQWGFVANDNTTAHRFTLSNSDISGNSSGGVYVGQNIDDGKVLNNIVHDNGNTTGIQGQYTTRLLISGNEVYNQYTGIYTYSSGDEAGDGPNVTGNRVHDVSTGISQSYDGWVRNNTVWAAATGIGANSNYDVSGNTVWGSTTGIEAGSVSVTNNTVYANTTGLSINSMVASGNRVYDNTLGVNVSSNTLLTNNLIWDNTTGVRLSGGHSGTELHGVANNTIVQTGGTAVQVENASNARIANNILDLRAGATGITVSPNSESGFQSDYNLFSQQAGTVLTRWEGRDFTSRPDWVYETGYDQHSRIATPNYVDANGADNLSGWDGAAVGAAVILDDGDAGVSFSGSWTTVTTSTPGYSGDRREANGNQYGTGSNTATYTFTGLQAGTYVVAGTWSSTSGNASNTLYDFYDGAATAANVVRTTRTPQYNLPVDYAASGANWRDLATVVITGDTLTVRVSDAGAYGKIVADAIRLQRIGGDHGADDDFHLLPGSAGVDGGDPTSAYFIEPLNNGARIDQGAFGNTPGATQSPAPLIQVTGPTGYAKLTVGTPVTIDWHTAGLLPSEPVLAINAGNAGPVAGGDLGNWQRNAYQTQSYSYSGFTEAVDLSGVTNAAPASVYQSNQYANGTVGQGLSYALPVADGSYVVRLHFAESYVYTQPGNRPFDIKLNGTTVQSNFDVRATAGANFKAVVREFTVTASGGNGINLDLITKNSGWGALISGIEVQRVVPAGDANTRVNLQVSLDSGLSWTTIASNLAMDRFGNGRTSWTPDFATAGNTALIRAIAVNGSGTAVASDTSDEPFLIANGGKVYYVNDGATANDEYTTAQGDNANSGKDAAHPMASLSALLRAYDVGPGDTIFVDSGRYNLITNTTLTARESGVRIVGALHAVTEFNRGNTNGGQYAINIAGASDVTLENLKLSGGQWGVVLGDNSGAHRAVLRNLEATGNTSGGIYVGSNVDDVLVTGNTVHDNGNSTGIQAQYATRVVITDNEVYNQYTGIYTYSSGDEANDGPTVTNNRVHNVTTGLSMAYEGTLRDNEVWESGTGLSLTNVRAEHNVLRQNGTGISASGSELVGNLVYANTMGIEASNSTVWDNRIYNNTTGLRDSGSDLIRNNVFWANVTAARIAGGRSGNDQNGFYNNTIRQTGGRAIDVEANATNVRLRNNVFDLSGATAIVVPANAARGFDSDYNLFAGTDPTAFVGMNWEAVDFSNLLTWRFETGNDIHSQVAPVQFRDADGADNVYGWSKAAVGSAIVLDDGDIGVSFTGSFTTVTGAGNGYGNDRREAGGTVYGTGSNYATYTFTDLAPGTYQIAATWTTTSGYAANTPYEVYDGLADPDNQISFQRTAQNTLPVDFTADGAQWREITTVVVTGHTLTVRVTDTGAYGKFTADAIRLQRVQGDTGRDDDFRLAVGSAGVDAGDPSFAFVNEPVNNGARIDMGAYGNTVNATQSPVPLIQVTGPNGYAKLEVGTAVDVSWHTAGINQTEPALLINAGNAGPVDDSALGHWLRNSYQTQGYSYTSFTEPVDLTGAVNPAPASVYQSAMYGNGTVGQGLSYELPVDDGQYVVRLHFAETYVYAQTGTRVFDIMLNGNTVQSNFDIRATAGANFKAVVREFNVVASGGHGIDLDLITKAGGALINGIEILRVVPAADLQATVDLQTSLDSGTTWQTLATGLSMDRFGDGHYSWTPDQTTAGNTALIRAVLRHGDGSLAAQDRSDEPFLIANGGTDFYVNDGSLTGDESSTAIGNNLNSGKDAAHPMSSLAALLRAYDLNPGDVVHVDSGVYRVYTNVPLEQSDSGVQISGPTGVGHIATINRGNTNTGAYTVDFTGADNVTVDHLNITGGAYGVVFNTSSDSDNNTLRANDISSNANDGISLGATNDGNLVVDNVLRNNAQRGIYFENGSNNVAQGNDIRNNATGLYFYGGTANLAVANKVHDNSSVGMYSYSGGGTVFRNNEVYNQASYGIQFAYGTLLLEGNLVHHNGTGIEGSYGTTLRGNAIYANTTGVQVYDGVLQGNRIYSNSVGIIDTGYSRIFNNVIYANTNQGVRVQGGHDTNAGDGLYNNTILQTVGEGIRLTGSAANVLLANNILRVDAGYGIAVDANSQAGFQSNYNLLYRGQAANAYIGLWNGATQATLAAWQAASGKDGNSQTGNPLFLDIDGADNILGEQGVSTGNGFDDNFELDAFSPAIDAGNAFLAPAKDIEGRGRRNDPDVTNKGAGWDLFVPADAGALFTATGTAKNFRTSDGAFEQALGFDFTFYGKTYNKMWVNAN